MAFYTKNDGFSCEYCGEQNPPAEKTCRNHCRKCLHSKHVDNDPGDRQNSCHGKMIPVAVFSGNKKRILSFFIFVNDVEKSEKKKKKIEPHQMMILKL